MGKKYMACKVLEQDCIPFQAFQEAQNSFFFAKQDSDVCYVNPYVILTDGHDIVVRENSVGEVDVGWRYKINRPNAWTVSNTPENFNKIVENGLKKCFIDMWAKVSIDHNDIKVCASNRGFYSLNRKKFYPIYFISIPNNIPVSFHFKDEKNYFPIMISTIAADHGTLPTTYAARKVMEMINAGEIILPEVRNG